MASKILNKHVRRVILMGLGFFVLLLVLTGMALGVNFLRSYEETRVQLMAKSEALGKDLNVTEAELASTSAALVEYLSQDQYLINQSLTQEITHIQKTYKESVRVYEDLLDLKAKTTRTATLDEQYATIVNLLANRNYTTASANLTKLSQAITEEDRKIATAFTIPENVPVNNSPPGSGYSRQKVSTDFGEYLVSIVSADLNGTRVIVDTASDGTCANDCPVMALGDYVSRSGAFAGINGPYFCPASYPSCAGKTNSFDTLLMNKNKVYFNSENNVFSSVPAVIFSGNSARWVGRSLEWGRDTGVDSVIANQPLLTLNGNNMFGGDGDPKKGSKGGRSFIGTTGSTVYIGVVHNATVAEAAHVIKAMGVQNALNLDSGGSTALWSGGYKVGPGRALPFGILLVRK